LSGIPQELALELEEHPQHLGNDKNHLAVRDIEEERLPHPLAPLLQPLGVARGTEAPGLTGKRQHLFRPAAWAADPGESTAGVAAIEVLFDHLFNDRTEEAVFTLKTRLVVRDKPLEMMEEHPVENGLLWMPRTVDSKHVGSEVSRNAPGNPPGETMRSGGRSVNERLRLSLSWSQAHYREFIRTMVKAEINEVELSAAEWRRVREGIREIERGHYTTFEEMKRGLSRRKSAHRQNRQ